MTTCDAGCDCEICCTNKPDTIVSEFIGPAGPITLATPEFFERAGLPLNSQQFKVKLAAPLVEPSVTERFGGDNAIAPATKKINELAQKLVGEADDTTALPALKNRIDTGVSISTVEVGNFMVENGISDVAELESQIEKKPDLIGKLLNAFFALSVAGFALNALCSILQNPFGILGDLISSIEDLVSNLEASLKGFLDVMLGAVESIFENLKAAVDNIVKGFEKSLKDLVGLASNAGKAIADKFNDMVQDAKAFFSDIAKEGILNKVKGIIGNLANSFSDLSGKDVLDFLTFLMCKMSTTVENMLKNPVDELKSFADKLTGEVGDLEMESAANSQKAAEAGRPIQAPPVIMEQCKAFAEQQNQAAIDRFNGDSSSPETNDQVALPSGPIISENEYATHPDPSEWSNLTFGPSLLNNSFWKSNHNVVMYDYFGTHQDYKGGRVAKVPNGTPVNIQYLGVKLDIYNKLNTVGKLMGITFNVMSGYRDPIYTQYLRNGRSDTRSSYTNGTTKLMSGAARNSQHMARNAVDLHYGGGFTRSNRTQVIAALRKAGFGGMGTYRWGLHIDVGPVRSWGG